MFQAGADVGDGGDVVREGRAKERLDERLSHPAEDQRQGVFVVGAKEQRPGDRAKEERRVDCEVLVKYVGVGEELDELL